MAGNELFGVEERREVNDVLETGILFRYGFDRERKGHWKTRQFESEIAGFTGAKHCLACSNGSAAVSIMLAAAGVGAAVVEVSIRVSCLAASPIMPGR